MKRTGLLLACLLILIATGCRKNKYHVEMRLDETGRVQREATLWTQDDNSISEPCDDNLSAARTVYRESTTQEDGKVRFAGTFQDRLPADLRHGDASNNGYLATTRNPFGVVYTYLESMPGERDIQRLLHAAESLIDLTTNVWANWVRAEPEFERDPAARDRLIGYLEGEFRADAMNLLLIGWQLVLRLDFAQELDSKPDNWEEQTFGAEQYRGVMYLVEHDYLKIDEVTRLMDGASEDFFADMLLRKATRVMGYESENQCPAALRALPRDSEKLKAVFESGLRSLGLSMEEYESRLNSIVSISFGDTETEIEVSFRRAQPPLESNGQWDATQGQVTWTARGRRGCEPPQMLYALWATPDEANQKNRFGAIVLDGERLKEYIAWYDNLNPTQRAEWDALLKTLDPAGDWKAPLRKFNFSKPLEAAAASQPTPEAPVRGAALILNENQEQ